MSILDQGIREQLRSSSLLIRYDNNKNNKKNKMVKQKILQLKLKIMNQKELNHIKVMMNHANKLMSFKKFKLLGMAELRKEVGFLVKINCIFFLIKKRYNPKIYQEGSQPFIKDKSKSSKRKPIILKKSLKKLNKHHK